MLTPSEREALREYLYVAMQAMRDLIDGHKAIPAASPASSLLILMQKHISKVADLRDKIGAC